MKQKLRLLLEFINGLEWSGGGDRVITPTQASLYVLGAIAMVVVPV